MANKKSVSPLAVLMPVYNAEKFLDDSIGSILGQTYTDFEFLILDDGSTDNSLKIIKAYAKKDKRIKVLVNKNNQKIAKNRNTLLKKATTEFIAWMDADDISLPHWLQTQIDYLKQNPNIDVVSCHLGCFGDRQFILKRPLLDSQIKSTFLFDCAFGTGGSTVKMKKIKANKLFFNEQLESAEDYDYWVNCCSVLSFSVIDEVLYKYRVHHLQNSVMNKKKQKQVHLLIVQKHLLKYNIKVTADVLKTTLSIYKKKFNPQKFQETLEIINQIFHIKNFYGYSSINKKSILKQFYRGYRKAGFRGKWFFIKEFGVLNYLKVKTW